ncbi:MAG TPA: spermidine/putrescine ABC transporter substrate-binding protein [Nitrospiraceae bacterium]|nr:spermidine/putrescine ABC transporter substrate-binding protein [Nitrospiraceae bacterium]
MIAQGLTRAWIGLIFAAGAAFSLACSQQPDSGTNGPERAGSRSTLHYFTWSDYVGQDILEEFERREQVRVVVDVFSSNEELLAKLQSGATGYDVAVPSDFMVAIAMQLGLLEELDHAAIPNAGRLAPHLQALSFDPSQRYSVPYLWGTAGIGYDSDVIETPPDSWAILWDRRYKGRISMLNDQREVFGATLRWMGHSLNSTEGAVIEAAKAKLMEQKPLVKTYTSDHYDQLLATGEVVLAHGWGGPIARAMRERPSIRYVVPKEGGTIWADCLVVLKTAQHKELAMRFINYLLEPGVAARTSERLLFAAAPARARDLVSVGVRQNPAVYPPDELLSRLEWLKDVGEAVRAYDRAWTELKMH